MKGLEISANLYFNGIQTLIDITALNDIRKTMEEFRKKIVYSPLQESDIVFNEVYSNEYGIRGYLSDIELDASEINEHNYTELCEIANRQYDFFMLHKKLSGYCIVEWRVIFATLFNYIKPDIANGTDNKILLEFHGNYEIKSPPELYKRMGLEF